MIAPCTCRGTQKYVHRDCLDRWRCTREDRAFSKCTECHFEYRMHVTPDSGGLTRKMKYRMMVTRDFLVIFLSVQFCICFLAWLTHGIDTSSCADGLPTTHTWGIGESHTHKETCFEDEVQGVPWSKPNADPVVRMFCGELRKTALCWCGIAPHDKTSYYIIGMVMFFAIIGLIGCCIGLSQEAECGGCQTCNTVDCYWCIWCDCNNTASTVQCGYCNCDCNNCDCGNCDGDAGGFILVVAIIVCIILAFVGLLIAVAFMAVMIQTIAQKHMHILQKREYTRAFLVADLDGMDLNQFSRSYEPIQYASLFEGDVPEMPPPAYGPMASAPPMSKEEMGELMNIGLM